MFQNRYKSFEQFEEHFKEIQKKTGYKTNVTISETYDYIQSWNYNIRVNKDHILTTVMKLANDFWPYFLNAHYEILEIRKSWFFLCSDVPFFIIPPTEWPKSKWIWLMYPIEAEKIIPLNKKQCLKITLFPKEEKNEVSWSYKYINEKMINRINTYICKNAERFIISNNKEYLRKIILRINFKILKKDKNREEIYYHKGSDKLFNNQFFPY